MPYAQLDDSLLDRLEESGLSRDSTLLYIEGLSYCSRLLTDGHIRARLSKFSSSEQPEIAAAELVEAGWWEKLDDGYRDIHYLSSQDPAETVRARQAAAAMRKRRSRMHRAGDHSLCLKGRFCPDGHLDIDVTRQNIKPVTRDETPIAPLHSPPDKEEGEGKGPGSTALPVANAPGTPSPGRPHIYAERNGACHLCSHSFSYGLHQTAASQILDTAQLLADMGADGSMKVDRRQNHDVMISWFKGYEIETTWRVAKRTYGATKAKSTALTILEAKRPTSDSSIPGDTDLRRDTVHAWLQDFKFDAEERGGYWRYDNEQGVDFYRFEKDIAGSVSIALQQLEKWIQLFEDQVIPLARDTP